MQGVKTSCLECHTTTTVKKPQFCLRYWKTLKVFKRFEKVTKIPCSIEKWAFLSAVFKDPKWPHYKKTPQD